MERFQAVIFDFNGVLVWDSHLHEQAWSEFAMLIRGRPLTSEEINLYVLGRPNAAVQTYLNGGTPLDPDTIAAYAHRKESLYRGLCLQHPEAFRLSPGAVELLDELVARDIPRTIATASDIGNLRFFIEQLGLERWFDAAKIAYDDGTFPNKPAPDIYQIAARKIDIAPERCIVVEDAVSGITAARGANIGKIVAMPSSTHPDVLAQQPGVSAVIPDFHAFDRQWLMFA